jgi:hypothetical protein
VSPAAKLKIGGGCLTAVGERNDVMTLQKASLVASPLASHKRASSVVALPYLASNRGRHMTSARVRGNRRTGPVDLREFRSLQILQQHCQRTVENDCWIAVWNNVTQQVLSPSQLVVSHAVDRHLDLVSLGRKRSNERRR